MINPATPGISALLIPVPYPDLSSPLPPTNLFEDKVDNEIHAFLSSVESTVFLSTVERAIWQASGE